MEKYKDPALPVDERVEDLLSRMTLEEKAAQLCGNLAVSFMEDGKVDMDALREQFSDGQGRFTQYSLVGIADPMVIAEVTNQLQHFFVEETRLGIPVALQSENLCGYPAAGGTIFPSMLNMASTWQPELLEAVADIIGQESKAVGINSAMSPVIDVSRDPRWGRTYETFGEDPYLVSQMGIHYIRGMQQHGIGCIAKHFLGYAESQAGLNCAAERIGDRELYETFATPFEAAAKEANVSGMMASYSEIDGIPVAANKKIARSLLRDTMGFKGMLTSDGGGVARLYSTNKVGSGYEDVYGGNPIFSGGYVDAPSRPLYPFGYGLSYTTFALFDLQIEQTEVPTRGGVIRLSVRVTNTGTRPGDEVVQLYTHFKDAYVTRPWKQLTGFLRVSLTPGQSKQVNFAVQTSQLGYYNEEMEFVVEPGALDIMVGTSSADIAFTQEIQLTGERWPLAGHRSYTSETYQQDC